MKLVAPIDELERLLSKSHDRLSELLAEIGISHQLGDQKKKRQALEEFSKLVRKASFFADLLGRKRAFSIVETKQQNFDKTEVTAQSFSLDSAFDLPFKEAMLSVLSPKLVNSVSGISGKKIIQDLTKTYGEDQNPLLFKMSGSPALEAIEEANKIVAIDLASGMDRNEAEKQLREKLSEWSDGHASIVYRNMIGKAYNAGLWRQIQDPAIKRFVRAGEYETSGDSDVRPEHAVWDGVILRLDNPVWRIMSPPVWHGCRCSFNVLSEDDLRRKNRIDRQGRIIESKIPPIPKENFGERADLSLYGVF